MLTVSLAAAIARICTDLDLTEDAVCGIVAQRYLRPVLRQVPSLAVYADEPLSDMAEAPGFEEATHQATVNLYFDVVRAAEISESLFARIVLK
jgi:hypothetical protein